MAGTDAWEGQGADEAGEGSPVGAESAGLARKRLLRRLRKEETVVHESVPRSGLTPMPHKDAGGGMDSGSGLGPQGPDGSRSLQEREGDVASPAASTLPAAGGTPVLKPLRLGGLTVPTPVVLSPMAGVTNWPFRVLCEEFGPDGLYIDEMITARALVAGNAKAWRLARFAPQEKRRSVQLYGVNPDFVEKAARLLVERVHPDHLDLNYGCPVAKITRHGGGSALPWKEDLFREDIRRVVRVCEPEGIPVTAKIRTGIDQEHLTYLEAGRIAQEEGCAAVILHGRTTAEYYGGHSDWSAIRRLKQELSIPVIGNGDIFSAEDALEMVRQTGCDGVAIGRGAQGRPWLFYDIKQAFAGSPKRFDPDLGKVCAIMLRQARMLVDFYDGDERMAVHDMRKHTAWYLKGFPVGGEVRRRFMSCESIDDLRCVMDTLDPSLRLLPDHVGAPHGRIRYQKKVHLPYGWLDSRTTTKEEREVLFGEDPLDATY